MLKLLSNLNPFKNKKMIQPYNKGDIFKINLQDDFCGYGQIVETLGENSIAVVFFKGLCKIDDDYQLKNIIADEILFFHNTFDAFLKNGRWVVVDNHVENLKNILLPYYIIGAPPDTIVEDFYENYIRQATKEDMKKIDFKGYVAPINLVEAFLDYHNLIKSDDDYNDLFYQRVIDSRQQ